VVWSRRSMLAIQPNGVIETGAEQEQITVVVTAGTRDTTSPA
jgi:hypothetical protein